MLYIYQTLNHITIPPPYTTIPPQYISVPPQYISVPPHPTAMTTLYGWNSSQTYRLYCYCNSVNYDLMLTLRNAFSIFISHRNVMHLSDIKSYNHPTTIYICPTIIYNHPTAIYIHPTTIYIRPTASNHNDYFVWMEQFSNIQTCYYNSVN